MCANKILDLGSAQYNVMLVLDRNPGTWLTNREISDAMELRKSFRFSGNDPVISKVLTRLYKAGLVEKRDREIKTKSLYDSVERTSWITEWKIIPRDVTLRTTFLEWEENQPESWHVVQVIDGEIKDLGKEW